MRSDIGDGVNLDGESFRNANGDGFNSDVVFESDAGLSWDANLIKFFIEAIHSEYGCNPNVDLDAINQIVIPYANQLGEGIVGNSEFLGEVRSVYMYACGLNQPPSSGVVTLDGGSADVSVDAGDFDYGTQGWKTNVLNDAGYWINRPFETEQISTNIDWAFGNFGAISPTPTGNGQCLPGGDGSSFPMSELMSKLGAPYQGSNPVNPERETYINQWFKFNVTACFNTYPNRRRGV